MKAIAFNNIIVPRLFPLARSDIIAEAIYKKLAYIGTIPYNTMLTSDLLIKDNNPISPQRSSQVEISAVYHMLSHIISQWSVANA